MKSITFFCLTLNPNHEETIKKLSYIPVGLGDNKFSINCFSDKFIQLYKITAISLKNKVYMR